MNESDEDKQQPKLGPVFINPNKKLILKIYPITYKLI